MPKANPKAAPISAATDAVLDAALPHVPFDGWTDRTLQAALADSGTAPALGPVLFPRGALDLALAYHRRGDRRMAEQAMAFHLRASFLRFEMQRVRPAEVIPASGTSSA